ncbi:MAG TPA: hypothetical protein VG873_00605 [Burkholderiales bacterium]|nr:hypothetical protein [Burkholderiales bacterium]
MPKDASRAKKERRRDPEQRVRDEKALEKEVDDALKGTFPASDPVAVDSAAVHAARRKRRKR